MDIDVIKIYNVVYSKMFEIMIDEISNSLETVNYNYAVRFKGMVYTVANSLDTFPEKFAIAYENKFYPNLNLRQFTIDKYRIIYLVNREKIKILSIISCLRDINMINVFGK
jgi:hypothetical protein